MELGMLERRGDRPLLNELMGVLKRRKRTIVMTALSMVVAVYVGLMFVTEKYEAAAQLWVLLGRQNTEVPDSAQKGNVYASGVQREEINSNIQVLKSRELIERVVDQEGVETYRFEPPPPQSLWQYIKAGARSVKRWGSDLANAALIQMGLRKELSEREKVIDLVAGSLDVQREGESNVIRLSVRLPSAEIAVRTASRVLQVYFDRYTRLRSTSTILPVLERQVAKDQQDLEALQDERQKVLRDWGLSSVESQRGELLKRLQSVQYETDRSRAEQAAAEARLVSLKKRTAAVPSRERDRQSTQPNPSVQSLKERLVTLRAKRSDLASRYVAIESPLVRQVDNEISALQAQLGSEDTRQQGEASVQVNPIWLSLQKSLEETVVQLAGLSASIKAATDNADAINRELARLNEGEAKLQIVDLQLGAAQKRFAADSARRDAARLDEILDERKVVNVAQVAAPSASPEPVSPQKLRILGFAAVGGIILGMVLSMLLEWIDDTIHGRQEVERATSLTYLGEFVLPDDGYPVPAGGPAPGHAAG